MFNTSTVVTNLISRIFRWISRVFYLSASPATDAAIRI